LSRRADRTDALLWLGLSVLLLFTIPIGYVSNDGLGHSRAFAEGRWVLNPNHLLFEPLGAAWQELWGRIAPQRAPVDTLKLLSVLAGAIAAALFRFAVASRLAGTRLAANHATAWLAFSSAFLRLWISDEFHMIQMPFVVAAAALALRYLEQPSLTRGMVTGAAAGLAGLCFLSNVLLGAALGLALAIWHHRRRQVRAALTGAGGIGAGMVALAGTGLAAAWLLFPSPVGFLSWLTGYGGGLAPLRLSLVYGAEVSPEGIAMATARALYGAASALVDLAPAVAVWRDRQPLGFEAVLRCAAFLAATAALLHGLRTAIRSPGEPANRGALLLTIAWLVAVLGFGIFWNNSDDQFYFQLAVVFGALAARLPLRRGRAAAALVALSCAGLLYNLADVTNRRVLYPRQERIALLEREVRGACLVLYPGFDEAELLLQMADLGGVERLPVTDVAVHHPPEQGLKVVATAIQECLAAGGRVEIVDVFDTAPERNPWKFLRRLGYERTALVAELRAFPLDPVSRRVGPFTLRSITPPAGTPASGG
jgi:hypothetical protein